MPSATRPRPASSSLPPPPTLPGPTPTPTPINDVTVLIANLDAPWAAQDWPTVITLLEQIVALTPDNMDMQTKLYAAYVNYGYRLAQEQKPGEAQAIFVKALTIFPDGAEALTGLQSVTNPAGTAPTPTPTLHLVRYGDTLFVIAKRYGVTVEAIRTANNLTDNTIYAGQMLIIPR